LGTCWVPKILSSVFLPLFPVPLTQTVESMVKVNGHSLVFQDRHRGTQRPDDSGQ
jgi:hypothetical protein